MSVAHQKQFASNLYYDQAFSCNAARILPGEYYFTETEMMIVTVLGSCVSACIRDKVSGLGGMNHFMLPDDGADGNSPVSVSMRYGSYAMEILINDLAAGRRQERKPGSQDIRRRCRLEWHELYQTSVPATHNSSNPICRQKTFA